MARKRSKRASKTSAPRSKRKGKARAAVPRRAQPKGVINAWEDDPAPVLNRAEAKSFKGLSRFCGISPYRSDLSTRPLLPRPSLIPLGQKN
jgi:hypothetical protein